MRAVIYTRVSTANQSTLRQVNELKKVEGFEIVKVFSEQISGFSKRIEERKQLQKMLQYIDQNQVKAILLHEISRLGRSTTETLLLLKKLEIQKTRLYIHNLGITLNDGNASEDIFSKLIVTIVSDLARLESDQLSMRIKSGIADRKRQGKTTGRRLGSTEDFQKFLVKPKTKAIKKYLAQGMSYSEIQKLCKCSYGTISKVKNVMQDCE